MCQGAAMANAIAVPLNGCRRRHVSRSRSFFVKRRNKEAAATGNTAAISPLSNRPVPIAAAQVQAQKRGRRSSESSARRNAHIASVIASVRVTSGIWIRVNSQRPMDVASTSPENKPARAENAQAANAATSQQSRTAESAEGIRAAQSCTPKTRKQIALRQ